jgi:hypothetical protein
VEPPIFLKQIDERIPGFLKDLQPFMKATEQILAAPAGTELTKAVQAQVAVAAEPFGGMLAASANGFGLPAEATARNLFDLVVGTLYLMKNPRLIDDFIEFGQLTVYRLMKNLSPESPQYQQARARDPFVQALAILRGANAQDPSACIMNPRTDLEINLLKDSQNRPLGRPKAIENLPFLVTSKLPINETQGTSSTACHAFVGNFEEMIIGMRAALRIEFLREMYAGNLQYGFLAYQTPAQQFIAFAVGRLIEHRIHLEIRLFVTHRRFDPVAILQQKEVAQERGRGLSKSSFPVCHPYIRGAPDGLFGPIIEVISERGTDLGFEFHRRDKLAFGHHNQVPFLLRTVITRQFQSGARPDIELIQPRVTQYVGNEDLHCAHLRATGDLAARSGIDLAALNLFAFVPTTLVPIALHGFL